MPDLSFTHTVLLGALLSAGTGLGGLFLARLVSGRRPGWAQVLGAAVASGMVAFVQFLLVDDGFGRLHVAYLWLFVTLPVLGAVVLATAALPAHRPDRGGVLAAGGLLGLALVGLYATHVEPRWLRTDRVSVDVEPLAGGEELRVGVLADLQTDGIGSYEYGAIDALMAEEPDLILVPGDVFQSDGPDFEAALPELRALLSRLEAPGGVFLTEGDIDSPGRMTFMTEGLDLQWLDEEVVTREVRGHTVHIGGISVHYDEPRARAAMDELARRTADELRILVSHRPDAAFDLEPGDVDLVVSGHTHGGQVALPLIGPPIKLSNVSREVAAGGLHDIDGVPVYLSTGVGLERATAPQVRFGARPSIGLLTLE